MRRSERIRQHIEQALGPATLKILDESSHHAGHSGSPQEGESHFRIEVISPRFEGLSRVDRHRLVYQALAGAFDEGLHALAIIAKAPGE